MLSILIPVYNYSIIGLVRELVQQGKELEKPFEILIWDDGSTNKDIRKANELFCRSYTTISYIVSDKNRGRAEVRNLLAEKAQYEWLLFLDADIFPANNFFLEKYISSIVPERWVYSGEIIYRKDVQENRRKKLRWRYGIKYEEASWEERKKFKYLHAKSANLFIRKEIFNQIKFPVLDYNYGFEDALFGLILQDKGIKLELVENPIYHEGIEENEVFMKKAEEAVKNIAGMIQRGDSLCSEIRIVQFYHILKKVRMIRIVKMFFNLSKEKLQTNLLSNSPNVKLFQVYKLGYLCHLLASE